MKRYAWLAMVLAGIALTAYSIYLRESTLMLAVIVPIVMVSGLWGIAGIGLIILGMAVGALMFFSSGGYAYEVDELPEPTRKEERKPTPPSSKEEKVTTRKDVSSNKGAILFIGPIPVVFGSDKKVAKHLLILGIVLFVVVFVGFFLMFYYL
jgi:uncharacterized protein (TIGR00304 family)